ncbi:hypothetical protein B0H17DRAFT_942799 [Mycena rosella]|uniref:CxC2-like cysteine cluster KDZ transposase-associated domain-containing protein n=1 Tax=Mycena rosella TaxID=1033263 RepID=A0AAD7D6N6_MYCRO|nr:hypothetical protein B0H17DRAFT_942799 [Mycena rosella]
MKAFLAVEDQLEDAIFSTKTHASLEGGRAVKCVCGKEEAKFRCPECGATNMVCAACLVKMHPDQNFHHVEEWDGSGFVRTPLWTLGHELHLAHGGLVCPNGPKNEKGGVNEGTGRKMVVVATNGIHVRVFFCCCGDARATPDYIQLVAARLFPATLAAPETVFRFDALNNFHVHNLVSKKTAQDYYRALQKLTNNVFPHKVQDRYCELLRVYRVWRYLALRHRTGQAQNIDAVITNRRPGSSAVRCPACLEVGFNIDKATLDALMQHRHTVTLFLSSDGNFKLQRKRKVDDPDDFALNSGNAYFPEDTQYKLYVSELGPEDDKCTCSELKAVRMQNITKFKNAVVTGVVAVQCARHGLFQPGGLVDLTMGKGYGHTDYALGHTLADAHDQQWVVLTYDVYCQFYVNISKRFKKWFPSLVGLIDKLSGAVPKMDIRNHIGQCQPQWSTNFNKFLAFLIGELIQGTWAKMNQFVGSTKEQNHGPRHDSLDDGAGQNNWDKLIAMAETLLRLYREACAAIRKRSPVFEQLTKSTDAKLIDKWSVMDKKWSLVNGKYFSPYDMQVPDVGAGPPTHRGAYEKLLTEELRKSLAGGKELTGNTDFIARGLRIEAEQHRIKVILRTSTIDKATRARATLRKEIMSWRIWQFDRFPRLQKDFVGGDPDAPQKEKLWLPSELNEPARAASGMQELAAIEYELRKGQVYDALADVQTAIKTFNFNVAFKIAQVQGQSANTRAQNFLQTLANDRLIAADGYRRARDALLRLRLLPTDTCLAALANEDLYAKNTRDSPKMGESGDVDPWFWTVGWPANLTVRQEADWSVESKCAAYN